MTDAVKMYRKAFDEHMTRLTHFYDRSGRPLRYSEWVHLRFRTPNYHVVRRHTVRGQTLITRWIGWGESAPGGLVYFETTLTRPRYADLMVGRTRTEGLAVDLHYIALRALLIDLDARRRDVRGWLEISA